MRPTSWIEKDFSHGRAARAEAQYPIAAILGCADSRVAPDFCSIRVLATSSSCVLPAISSTRMASPASNMPSSSWARRWSWSSAHQLRRGRRGDQSGEGADRAARPSARADQVHRARSDRRAWPPSERPGCRRTEENVRLNVKRLVGDAPIMSEPLAAKKIAVAGGVYDLADRQGQIARSRPTGRPRARVADGDRGGGDLSSARWSTSRAVWRKSQRVPCGSAQFWNASSSGSAVRGHRPCADHGSSCAGAIPAGPVSGSKLTPDFVREVGRFAYLWGGRW